MAEKEQVATPGQFEVQAKEVREVVDAMVNECIKFDKGVRAAGVRIRQLLQQIKNKAHEMRGEVQKARVAMPKGKSPAGAKGFVKKS